MNRMFAIIRLIDIENNSFFIQFTIENISLYIIIYFYLNKKLFFQNKNCDVYCISETRDITNSDFNHYFVGKV